MNILPRDIDASQHLWNAFNHRETEISAGWIVRYCQERGNNWDPISLDDLQWFYEDALGKSGPFHFNRLMDGWIVRIPTNSTVNIGATVVLGHLCTKPCAYLQVNHDFVKRCYHSSPKRNLVNQTG